MHHFDSGGQISVKFALNIYRSWRMMTPDLFQPLSGRNITTGKISYSVREILVQNAEHIHNPTGTCPLDCNGPTTFQSCKILCDTRIYFTQTGFPGWYFIFSLIMWQCTCITTASFKALARKTESAQSTPQIQLNELTSANNSKCSLIQHCKVFFYLLKKLSVLQIPHENN